MANYPVAQESAIMIRLDLSYIVLCLCSCFAHDFQQNFIKLHETLRQWHCLKSLFNKRPHLLCARICISNFSSPFIPRAIGHSSNYKHQGHLLALDTVFSCTTNNRETGVDKNLES